MEKLEQDVGRIFEKLETLTIELTKLSVTQIHILDNQKARLESERKFEERLASVEKNINYAAGLVAFVVAFITIAANSLWKKVAGQ